VETGVTTYTQYMEVLSCEWKPWIFRSSYSRDNKNNEHRKADAYLFVAEDIVGSDAGLAGVGALAPHHALGRQVEVPHGLVDDGGTLAAQLQGHRREELRGSLHDDLADARAAREEDLVPAQLEQVGGDTHAAGDDLDAVAVDVAGQLLEEHLLDGGGHLAGLDQHAVARGDGAHQGAQLQVQVEVRIRKVSLTMVMLKRGRGLTVSDTG